jgi:serpin B
LRAEKVDIKLPKFDISQDMDVKKVLMAEGVRDLFDESSCDLSGMHNGATNDVYISDYLHKAKVKIDAKGTVASAATVAITASRMFRPSPPPIIVDVPFFFGIYYARTNAFLFTGVINDPTSS